MPWSLKKNHRLFCKPPIPRHTRQLLRDGAPSTGTHAHTVPVAEKQAGLSSPSATGSSEDVEVGEALLASDIVGYLDGVEELGLT